MKSDKKTLVLLGIATTFTLATIGAYAFLFIAMKNKTETTATLSEKIDELSGREARIASSVSVLRRENTNIEKISNYFFKENEVVAFTKKVEALGGQSGTTLTIESLDQGFTEKTVPFLNFRIKALGTFANINRLMVLLENFPGKLEWKTVRLVRDADPILEVDATTNVEKPVSGTPLWRVEASLVALNFVN
jgi:hypothetical protein